MTDTQSTPPANISPAVDPKLLEILVCPITKATLHYDRDAQALPDEARQLG